MEFSQGRAIIRKGLVTHIVMAEEHRQNTERVKLISNVLQIIAAINTAWPLRPKFIIEEDGASVVVTREDYREQLLGLIARDESYFTDRLSVSEWRILTDYNGENPSSYPETLHDVYTHNRRVTVKTGNPFRNNSWEEFHRALQARWMGIVEAKSPIGFSFQIDDLYGIRKPGKMFYKHINAGIDLEGAAKYYDKSVLNWVVFEAAKFFSRLIKAELIISDSERLGNYFIEEGVGYKVFRFLDLEGMYHIEEESERGQKNLNMIDSFVTTARASGLITENILGEFIFVSWGNSHPEISYSTR